MGSFWRHPVVDFSRKLRHGTGAFVRHAQGQTGTTAYLKFTHLSDDRLWAICQCRTTAMGAGGERRERGRYFMAMEV